MPDTGRQTVRGRWIKKTQSTSPCRYDLLLASRPADENKAEPTLSSLEYNTRVRARWIAHAQGGQEGLA